MNKIKKIIVRSLIITLMVSGTMILIEPGTVYCDQSLANGNNPDNNSLIENSISGEIKPAAPEKNDSFFPMLIASMIVLGIMAFGLWQTFKSRRQY